MKLFWRLLVTIGLGLSALPIARADFLHAFGYVTGGSAPYRDENGNTVVPVYSDRQEASNAVALLGAVTTPHSFASSSAITSPYGDSLIRLYQSSFSEFAEFNSGGEASALYSDLINFKDGSQPGQIRIQIGVEANMYVQSGLLPKALNEALLYSTVVDGYGGALPDYAHQISFVMPGAIFLQGTRQINGDGTLGDEQASIGVATDSQGRSKWDSLTITPSTTNDFNYHIEGVQSATLTYDPLFGGYGFGFQMSALTENLVGSSHVDVRNTGKILGIYTADGTLISPDALTFTSGLQVNAVPEPSSLLLFAATTGLCAVVRCRRRSRSISVGVGEYCLCARSK